MGVADVVVTCPRLCSLAQSTKQEMEVGATLRRSEDAEPASSEEDSGLDVKVSNTTEEQQKDKTPESGRFFSQSGSFCLNLDYLPELAVSDPETEQPKPPEGPSTNEDAQESEDPPGGEVRTGHISTTFDLVSSFPWPCQIKLA